MSDMFEVTSGRKKEITGIKVTTPLEQLLKIDFFKETFKEIERDMAEASIRRDPDSKGARDHIAVFIDLQKPAKRMVQAIYEQAGWVVEFEPGTIKFYFY